MMSLPPWERGLKSTDMESMKMAAKVAPPVGAWIEILYRFWISFNIGVAPPVGAWIEIPVIL